MNNRKESNRLREFINNISYYLENEYMSKVDGLLTDTEQNTIKQMIISHYNSGDNAANTAHSIIDYVRKNRPWIDIQ